MSCLSLEQFRTAIGYHPYHFWGLGNNTTLKPTSTCNTYIRKYRWQNADASGRQDVVTAIEQAEHKIQMFLGYSPMPTYFEEIQSWPKYLDSKLFRYGASNPNGFRLPVKLNHNKVVSVGSELRTLLASSAVVISDANSDGINDTFTLGPIATSATKPEQIRIYFSLADRFGDTALSENWRVRPVSVTFSGGQVTIKGPLWLIVKPQLYEGYYGSVSNPIDPATSTNFVSTLDVYTYVITPDGQTLTDAQCVLRWETLPCEGWWCCDLDSLSWVPTDARYDPAAVGMAIGRVGIRDAENGIVLPAQALYNTTSSMWIESWNAEWREPNSVLIRYQAGDALGTNGELASEWQTLIARMACAELADRICSCDEANKEIWRWQVDFTARKGLSGDSFNAQPGDLENPFGTRAGHIDAWRRIKVLAKVRGLHT